MKKYRNIEKEEKEKTEWRIAVIWTINKVCVAENTSKDTDSILQLTRVPPAGIDLRLFYPVIYQVNWRPYFAKYIIFMACFLAPYLSYQRCIMGGSGAVLRRRKSYKRKLWIFHYKTLIKVSRHSTHTKNKRCVRY